MNNPKLVEDFYNRIWNAGDLDAIPHLLTPDFSFRGSLGVELHGRDAFSDYVREIRTALENYRCEILECVSNDHQAFAKMRFGGTHAAPFRGYPPTGKPVHWLGAALFTFRYPHIADLWVLGDLSSLDALLRSQSIPV